MKSKRQLLKYVICGFLYISMCLGLLFMRINYTSRVAISKFNGNKSIFILPKKLVDEGRKIEVGPLVTTIEAEIIVPLRRITSVCKKYNKTTLLERERFFYSPVHKVLYCWIRKVASTSFSKFLADLRGIHTTGNIYKEVDKLAPRSLEELFNLVGDARVFKFLVVRHPFERLVSAFRDRIEDNSRYSAQSWIFAPRIFYLTRPELFHFNDSIGNPLQRIFYIDRRLQLIPSFEEFIRWLLRQPVERDDDHWSQYHSHCSVCKTSFDFILQIDSPTVETDLDNLYTNLGLKYKRPKLQRLSETWKGSTNFNRSCIYFSCLTKSTFDQLYSRYKIDFEMFGYSPDPYSACIKA